MKRDNAAKLSQIIGQMTLSFEEVIKKLKDNRRIGTSIVLAAKLQEYKRNVKSGIVRLLKLCRKRMTRSG